MTAYTLKPWIGAESSGAAEEGCYSYGIAIDRPGYRGFVVGSYEDGDALAAAVARAQADPAYLVELLLQSMDLRQHYHEAARADWERERARQRALLEEAEPAASDLAGRVAAALAALGEAGELMQAGASAAAWLAVVRAAESLEQPGGLSQEQAALRACALVDAAVFIPDAATPRHAGVVSARWDALVGVWYVECRSDADAALWEVAVTADQEELINAW